MDKLYDHTKHESEIYTIWEESGAFTPPPGNKARGKSFTVIMPPPNANDPLHIGHARFVTIEDILVRYHRMKGEDTLWLPGTDHAGIETQYVFEKRLAEKGKSRFDYDRETLYKMIWDYVQEYSGTSVSQMKRLGASADWSRIKFTLDPEIQNVVYRTFKKLYDDGLVYRGERIINYCTRCGTSFSELEVNHVEKDGLLYHLDYGTVTIATTRPETIFADVAVAVNASDQRYKKLVGKTATIPLVNRSIPIIADTLVQKEVGTGALKVTPGHDATDFEIGQKHNLPVLKVMDETGKMINVPQKYAGLWASQARAAVVEDLTNGGFVKKAEKIKHIVGTCYRDKSTIEPMVSKQWFIKVTPLAQAALKAISNKKVKITAPKYEKVAKHWLRNLKDWNVSRQIVWGMRIPAFRCDKCLAWTITQGEAPANCRECGHAKLVQDTDTFDTWFSSGQWPYATLQTGKPGDFDHYYPTSVMNTAYDILPFWIIRMIMLGIYIAGDVPFKTVLFHGLVRDKDGVKISKSKGNVINPIEMADKYGADALRMGLIWGALVENDIALSEDNIKGQRNFANKMWNVARFISQYGDGKRVKSRPRVKDPQDKWILEELRKTSAKITKSLDNLRLNEAAEELYEFVWKKLADKHLEQSKPRLNSENPDLKAIQTLSYVLDSTVRLAHPFMPFATEAIWKNVFKSEKGLLISAQWPVSPGR